MLKKNQAQSTLEYAIIIGVVVGALITMQIYLKRSVEGKLRQSTDQIGEQFEAGDTAVSSTAQYNAKTVTTLSEGVTTSNTGYGGEGTPETRIESGSEEVGEW